MSWFQPVPQKSLQLIRETGITTSDPIIDAGGGASTLVDHLLDEGFTDITVLDISASALDRSRARLGERADAITWIVADVTEFEPDRRYALWHDRAVLHFLTESADRARYVAAVRQSLRPGGHLLLATFGPQGPLRCSGLEIRRYDVPRLEKLLEPGFELRAHEIDDHETPGGSSQQFLFSWWQMKG